MRIEQIDIESFGKLRRLHINLGEGINVIRGDNESGKSTVAAFIKFIFFGFTKEEFLPTGEIGERERYTSWDSGRAAGSLTVKSADKMYKIERDISANQREICRITDIAMRREVYMNESPGRIFLRCDRETYERTALMSQNILTHSDRPLSEMASNIMFTADEDISARGAIDSLNAVREQLYNKHRTAGLIVELTTRREEVIKQLEKSQTAQKQMYLLEDTINDLEERIAENNEKSEELQEELENYKAYMAYQELQKIEGTRKQLLILQNALDKSIARNSTEDFTPTLEYADEIEEAATLVNAANEKFEVVSEQLSFAQKALDEETEKNKGYIKIAEMGGTQEINGRYVSRKKAIKTLSIAFYAFLVAAIAAGVVLGLSIWQKSQSPYYPLIGCIAALVLMVLSLYLREGTRRKNREMVNSLDFGSELLFEDAILEYPDYEGRIETCRSEIAICRDMYDRQKEETRLTRSYACELLLKWERTPVDDGSVPAEESISCYAKLVRESLAEIEEAKALYDNYSEILAKQLENVAEDELIELAKHYKKPPAEREELDKEIVHLDKANETMKKKGQEIEENIAVLNIDLPDPTIPATQLDFLDRKIEDLTKRYEVYTIAAEMAEQCLASMRGSLAPTVSAMASKLFEICTGGKYLTLGANEKLELSITQNNKSIDIAAYSRALRDTAEICLKFALLELLYNDDPPPFIFDDSFGYMDDKRFETMAKLINNAAEDMQIVVFTCHEREARAFNSQLFRL